MAMQVVAVANASTYDSQRKYLRFFESIHAFCLNPLCLRPGGKLVAEAERRQNECRSRNN